MTDVTDQPLLPTVRPAGDRWSGPRHASRRRTGERPITPAAIRVALLVIMAVGLLRGLFWIAAFPTPTLDEGAHLSEIESIAHGHYPVEGRAPTQPDILRLFKTSPTNAIMAWRSTAISPTASDPRWGLAGQNYEADQPPLYYAVMVPSYWLGQALGGARGALFLVRLTTLVAGLLAIPLLAAAGRRLFPDRPATWVLAPAVLVAVQLFSSGGAAVDNDGLTVLASVACLLALLRAWRRPDIATGIVLGLCVGAAVLVKGTVLALAPLLALGCVGVLLSHRRAVGRALRCLSAAASSAIVVVTPWLAWNAHAYGAVTGAKVHQRLTAQVIAYVPLSVHGLDHAIRSALGTFWTAPQLNPSEGTYQAFWWIVLAVGAGGGLLAALLGRSRRSALRVLWLIVSLPLGLGVAALATVASTHAKMEGRYLLALLPIACLVIAWAAPGVFGARLGTVALLASLTAAGILEVHADNRYLARTYQTARYGAAVPAVDQTYATTIVPASTVSVANPPCPARIVSFHLNQILPQATVNGAALVNIPSAEIGWASFRLPAPSTRGFTVLFRPSTFISAASLPSRPVAALPGSRLTPLVRLYCVVGDPASYRFDQTFPPGHPFPMSWSVLSRTPLGLAAAGAGVSAATVAALAWVTIRRRRTRFVGR